MTDPTSFTRVIADEQVLAREVDHDIVLYHPATDAVTHLDAIAAQVWQGLAQAVDVSELIATLAARFDADPAVVDADVRALLDELFNAKLIRSA